MRALEPTERAHLRSHGFTIGYEVFGETSDPAVMLLPTWQIVHMRHWKMQIPYLVRHRFRVVAYDSAGNGLAERTEDARAFEYDRVVDQGIHLLDHLGIQRADVIGFSRGSFYGILMASRYPERVGRLVIISNNVDPLAVISDEERAARRAAFWTPRASHEGAEENNAHFWLERYPEWLAHFFGDLFSEPHSTKGFDDTVSWGLETTPQILVRTVFDPAILPAEPMRDHVARVRCPVLVLHGSDDRIAPVQLGRSLAAARPDFAYVELEGNGHGAHVRDPVRVNLEIRGFLDAVPAPRRWQRAMARQTKRALFVCSPIGLGHALRDVAIAEELRHLVPGLEIEWLAQHPVMTVLERSGERVHPLSAALAGESRHIESELAGEHDLRVFRAWRNMDEILLANFMVFHDAVKDGDYDLWVGDEAWDVDHYLHENPELKSSPFAWLTDFVGWLPIAPDPDGREVTLTADYNAEMIEHVERFPRVRDAALFVGNAEDVVPEPFGPGLPSIREWTARNYDFAGYVQYFDPRAFDREALRERFGFRPDERVALASVGGTGVGASLLRRIIEAYPFAKDLVPELRMIVVCGPRIDPASLPQHRGIEYRAYVHHLYEMLAAIDIALVQGGLSTCMELVALQRPFLHFPLQGHFEQNIHVPFRLRNYLVPAEAKVDFACASPEAIAQRLARTLAAPIRYREIDTAGARRAADRLAALL